MHRKNIDRIIAKHFETLMPSNIKRLFNLVYADLLCGPLTECNVCGNEISNCECEVKWPGFSKAIDRIKEWASEALPSEVWVDMDCEEIFLKEPVMQNGDDLDPYFPETYYVDHKEIKRAVFGEVGDYL